MRRRRQVHYLKLKKREELVGQYPAILTHARAITHTYSNSSFRPSAVSLSQNHTFAPSPPTLLLVKGELRRKNLSKPPSSGTGRFIIKTIVNPIHLVTNKEKLLTTYIIFLQVQNLIYLIQCNNCKCQFIGETNPNFNERFGEHRRSILSHHQLSHPTPVSLHFKPRPGH